MNPSSEKAVSSAPEFAGILRKRLEDKPIKQVAVEAACDASLMGKFLSGQAALKLPAIEKLMTLAELKAVVINRVCVRQHEIEMLRRLYAVVSDNAPWLLNEAEA